VRFQIFVSLHGVTSARLPACRYEQVAQLRQRDRATSRRF